MLHFNRKSKERRTAPPWKSRFESKVISPTRAAELLKNGDRVFVGSLCAEPRGIVRALHGSPLEDIELVQLRGGGETAKLAAESKSRFRLKTFSVEGRKRGSEGWSEADYVPLFHSDIPRFFRNRRIPIDVAIVQVSEPDRFGQVSLGISVDITRAAIQASRIVIAQVNPRMPRTLGDTFLPAADIDFLVEAEEELPELQQLELTDVDRKICAYTGELIEDGAIIQSGFALISRGLIESIRDRKNLGVHSEMFTDHLIDLVESGVVTNATKKTYRGKSVATFCLGTKRLYDYVDNNPLFEFHPSDVVLNPSFIAENDKMVAINIALQVDLRGQIRQGSLGWTQFEGSGGEQDFMRGAALSRGGRSIVCVRSTDPEGKSTIVPSFGPKAAVIMNRGDVTYVVTEYGAAYLGGKSIRERALALIEIAHPNHRESLMEQARELGYVYPDQYYVPSMSPELRERIRKDVEFRDGLKAHVRAVKTTDESMVRDLFYQLSKGSVYFRYFSPRRSMPHQNLQKYVNLPEEQGISLVITVGPKERRRMIAEGRFVQTDDDPLADAAMMVDEEYHGKGIGTFLLTYLIELAKERGVPGFKADIISSNAPPLRILEKLPYNVESRVEDGVRSIRFRFDKADKTSEQTTDTGHHTLPGRRPEPHRT
jgi:acyl-CoA hydrolase/GNAT superfamily N-acetyltransferase